MERKLLKVSCLIAFILGILGSVFKSIEQNNILKYLSFSLCIFSGLLLIKIIYGIYKKLYKKNDCIAIVKEDGVLSVRKCYCSKCINLGMAYE